jgi:hypothetical protein
MLAKKLAFNHNEKIYKKYKTLIESSEQGERQHLTWPPATSEERN